MLPQTLHFTAKVDMFVHMMFEDTRWIEAYHFNTSSARTSALSAAIFELHRDTFSQSA